MIEESRELWGIHRDADIKSSTEEQQWYSRVVSTDQLCIKTLMSLEKNQQQSFDFAMFSAKMN